MTAVARSTANRRLCSGWREGDRAKTTRRGLACGTGWKRGHRANGNIQTAYQVLGNRTDQKLAYLTPGGGAYNQPFDTVFANEVLDLVDGIPATNLIDARQLLLSYF